MTLKELKKMYSNLEIPSDRQKRTELICYIKQLLTSTTCSEESYDLAGYLKDICEYEIACQLQHMPSKHFEIVLGARSAGKTYQMIHHAYHQDLVIVCFSEIEKQRVKKFSEELKMNVEVISWHEYLHSSTGKHKKYAIDNLDICLKDVSYISLTK